MVEHDAYLIYRNANVIPSNNIYFITLYGEIIGHFKIIERSGDILIDYALEDEYQGYGLGYYALNIIEDYLDDNFNFEKYVLLIRYDNERSRKVAIRNGYRIDYEMSEKMSIDGEMTMFSPFYKERQKLPSEKVLH